MLTKKEKEDIFRILLDTKPFEESEIAQIEACKVAEEGYERLSLQLQDRLQGGNGKLFNDMLSYQIALETYRNMYYLWQGYLKGKEEKG